MRGATAAGVELSAAVYERQQPGCRRAAGNQTRSGRWRSSRAWKAFLGTTGAVAQQLQAAPTAAVPVVRKEAAPVEQPAARPVQPAPPGAGPGGNGK